MKLKDFARAGNPKTLFAAFLYFDMSFMVWVLLGPLGVHIAKDLGLTPSQKGMMVAVPVLSGAIMRVFMGLLVDSFGAKRAGLMGQAVVLVSLLSAWIFGVHNLHQVYLLGLCLGVAGASFAVALPLASRWYPPEAQGLALGIAGAGNSGTVFSALFAPVLASHFGWNNVLGLVLIPLSITMVIYSLMAKDAPGMAAPQKFSKYFQVLKQRDAWWFMLFYMVTFGGFVGLASSLVIYFNSQFGVAPATAGYLTAACVFCGSMFRPIGGNLADRFGGVKALQLFYIAVVISMLAIAMIPAKLAFTLAFFVVVMMAMGMSKQLTGDYRIGFLMYALLGAFAFGILFKVKLRWRATWGAPSVARARV